MFVTLQKNYTFASAIAKVAQLVEHNLAKVRVAGSNPVFRSLLPRWRNGRRARFRCEWCKLCKFESCSGHNKKLQNL